MSYEAATNFIATTAKDARRRQEIWKLVHDDDRDEQIRLTEIVQKGQAAGYDFTPQEIQEAYSAWSAERDIDEEELAMIAGGAGPCYIATATLKLQGTEAPLTALRAWRDAVLTRTAAGRRLEAYYDHTGPVVAAKARDSRLLSASFLYPFVLPAVGLAKQRQATPLLAPLCDAMIYGIFLAGLAYGTVCYHLLRK